MALKPKHKRNIIWSLIALVGALVLSVILIPPMITLNSFKPMVEKSVFEQTNVPAKLNGNIHFSLVGGATIVAHDVVVPTARIGSVMFSIPFHSFFDLQNAKLNDAVVIYDADISVDKLAPAMFNHNIEIYNSNITFMGRVFHIVRADFTDGIFNGTIRTDDHKYDVKFAGDTFYIKNKTNNLDIVGHFFPDGTIRGHIFIETENINQWFGFTEPRINKMVALSTDFEWDGKDGYKFTNINFDNISGSIDIQPNGHKDVRLVSDDLDFDFSFLLHPNDMMYHTNINLDFYGNLTLGNHVFNHIRIQAIGTNDKIQIANFIADDIAITGGTITPNGATNIFITMPIDNVNTTCLYSGTPEKWKCSKFTYGDMFGSISVSKNKFDISVKSENNMPSTDTLTKMAKNFGTSGTIKFRFANAGGTYTINGDQASVKYTYAQDKTLRWLQINLPFLPKYMTSDVGDFAWDQGQLTFTPHNNQWQLSIQDNYFHLIGDSFKKWLPNIDLQFINDAPYTISGYYNNNKISNLKISVNNHEFSGSVSDNHITLHTPQLSIDSFMNQYFIDHYAELEFLTNAPIMSLFNLPINISLSADKMIYNNNEFSNFVYSLKPNAQIFSITDTSRGNMLTTIERNKNSYDIFVQLNRFVINGALLSSQMPLNIRDTTITAEIALKTYGQIAHDIYYNMTGTMDLSFEGGFLSGMSFDEFYASAPNITSLNAEYALANALTGGETMVKKMRIIGDYSYKKFITTEPLRLSMRHTDAIGGLAITDGYMTAEFDITMRGTAPTPATIQLSVLPDGSRSYSLSEIMQDFDIGFMRAFIETHDKF